MGIERTYLKGIKTIYNKPTPNIIVNGEIYYDQEKYKDVHHAPFIQHSFENGTKAVREEK